MINEQRKQRGGRERGAVGDGIESERERERERFVIRPSLSYISVNGKPEIYFSDYLISN